MVYDPEFTSAKNRAKKGLNILEQDNETALYEVAGSQILTQGPMDAWICILPELQRLEATFEVEDPKAGSFYHEELLHQLRSNLGITSTRTRSETPTR